MAEFNALVRHSRVNVGVLAGSLRSNESAGGKRGIGLNDERDQTLNQLLTELDGFDGRAGVLMLAATNRPEVIPPSLGLHLLQMHAMGG